MTSAVEDLGVAARAIRADWERETWNRRDRLYNVAVSNLLLAIALGEDWEQVVSLAHSLAAAYSGTTPHSPADSGCSPSASVGQMSASLVRSKA